MPYFSIILPTYNRAHLLSKAIESVLAQTFTDWELVIVDDGSTDNTKELVTAYADDRIRYIYQENQERSAARNNGIKQSRGAYICFLDSDDYFLKDKLLRFHEVSHGMETTKLFYDAMAFEKVGELGPFHLPMKKKEETLHEFLLMNPLGALQLCIPVAALKQELFNPSLRIGEDVELWLRLADIYEFIAVKSNNTIAVEHDERSVNQLTMNDNKGLIDLYKMIFSKVDFNSQISLPVKKIMIANCYFRNAKYYMSQHKLIYALFWTLKSIIKNPHHPQIKHFMFCFKSLILFQIPKEYKNL